MQQAPTLWDRMSAEDRAAIESYEHVHSRDFCIDFLKSRQFYMKCTFDEIITLLLALNKEFTLYEFQNLFY
jgi:hypothetical protein